MRKLSKVFTFIFLVAFSLSCDNEGIDFIEAVTSPVIEEAKTNLPFDLTTVSLDDIPFVADEINNSIEKDELGWSEFERGKNRFWLKEKDIVKVENEDGAVSYSIRIKTDIVEPTSLYNLIVARREDGKKIKPFVMEYEFESYLHYEAYMQEQSENKRFIGKIHTYSLRQFIQSTRISFKTARTDSCGSTESGSSNTDTGTNNNNEGTQNSGATTTEGSTSWASEGSTDTGEGSGGNGTKGYVEVGEGEFGEPEGNTEKNGSVARSTEDCPTGIIKIGINTISEWLCGTYKFSSVGDALVANVTGLGFMAVSLNLDTGVPSLFQVKLPNVCITIPNRYSTPTNASKAVVTAYNSARIELFQLVNVVPKIVRVDHDWYQKNLTRLFEDNLNAYFSDIWINTDGKGYVRANRADCPGVATNAAQWCD